MDCRICGSSEVRPFLRLGETALANSYLSERQLSSSEPEFPLEVAFCPKCCLVQLTFVVPPELLFKHYLYVTSTSNTFRVHFTQMAESIVRQFGLGSGSLAVDIGSNDGLLLRGFLKFGVKVVGVEPASNVAKIAEADGIYTINDFFTSAVVDRILAENGKADIITANNVFAHTTTIHDIAEDVKRLLKDDGVFVIEAAYLVDMLEQMTFDAVYHEHLFYYSLTTLDYFFRLHGMLIFRVEHVSSHGGSLRVFVKKESSSMPVEQPVSDMLYAEERKGVRSFSTYAGFAGRVESARSSLVSLLRRLKSSGASIAAYGAPAKATTLLSFCNIGKETIDYIVDDSPLKQGLFMPGSRIPIVSQKMLDEKTPDYILILAWNFADEILKKTKPYADRGVKFIIPFPEPVVV